MVPTKRMIAIHSRGNENPPRQISKPGCALRQRCCHAACRNIGDADRFAAAAEDILKQQKSGHTRRLIRVSIFSMFQGWRRQQSERKRRLLALEPALAD